MNLLSKIVFVACLSLSGAAIAADAPMSITGATTIDGDKLIKLIESAPNLVILDNRKEGDFSAGHIEGAVRLIDTDITGPDSLAAYVKAKDNPVAFYCNGVKCGRAAAAAEKAVGYGYTKVYYYALGMDEWKSKGLPLVTK